MKKTLIEKMKLKNVPSSWIREIEFMMQRIERRDARIREYGLTIDALARKKEWLEIENASMNKRIAEIEDASA